MVRVFTRYDSKARGRPNLSPLQYRSVNRTCILTLGFFDNVHLTSEKSVDCNTSSQSDRYPFSRIGSKVSIKIYVRFAL